jgi:hypothetical protein
MATTVQDHDQAVRPRARFAIAGASILLLVLADNTAVFGGLHALDGLLIAASAGVQYALARRR